VNNLTIIRLGGLLRNSYEEYKKHFLLFIKVSVILYFIPTLFFGGIFLLNSLINPQDIIINKSLELLNSLFTWLFRLLLTFTIIKILLLKRSADDEMGAIEALGFGKEHFLEGIGLSLLVSLVLLGPLVFLIFMIGTLSMIFNSNMIVFFFLILLMIFWSVFFIILSIYWVFSLYALITDDVGITSAMGHSYNVVKEKWWLVFSYLFVQGLIIIGLYMIILLPFYVLGISFGYLLDNLFISTFMAFLPMATLTVFVTPFTLTFMEKFYLNLKENTKNLDTVDDK